MLVVAFVISLAYEAWRATARAGTSPYDSPKAFVEQLVLYVAAAGVVAALLAELVWAAWAGLVFCVVMILVSVFYYNPVIMPARQPAVVDWVEDLVFTGLLFVGAVLLFYEVAGWSLQR